MIRQARFQERIWYEGSKLEKLLEETLKSYGLLLPQATITYRPEWLEKGEDYLDWIETEDEDGGYIPSFSKVTLTRVLKIDHLKGFPRVIYRRDYGPVEEQAEPTIVSIYNVQNDKSGRSEKYLLDTREAIKGLNNLSKTTEEIMFYPEETIYLSIRKVERGRLNDKFELLASNWGKGRRAFVQALNSYYGSSFRPSQFLSIYDKKSSEGQEWREREEKRGEKSDAIDRWAEFLENHGPFPVSFSTSIISKLKDQVRPSHERSIAEQLHLPELIEVLVRYFAKIKG